MLKTQIRIDEMKDCAKITKHHQIINSKFLNIAKNMQLKPLKSNFYQISCIEITIKPYFFVQIFSVLYFFNNFSQTFVFCFAFIS